MRTDDGINDDVTAVEAPTFRRETARTVVGWGLTATFVGLFGVAAFSSYAKVPTGKDKPGAKKNPALVVATPGIAGLSTADSQAFAARFDKEVWPVVQEACAPCHGQKNPSQFLVAKESRAAFLQMLGEGLLDPENHVGMIERISTTDKDILMPPPTFGKLTRAQIAVLTKFTEDLEEKRRATKGAAPDEAFPAHLELPFSGKKLPEGMDNTFLTYGQLKNKVKTIFGDDWVRGDRDLFVENVSLFGGADFIKRFDESAKASPTYFTGVDLMARDVASRSYLARTGPFAGFPSDLPAPTAMKAPDARYTAAIDRMYDRMLFRTPSPTERKKAFAFLQDVYRAQGTLTKTAAQDLRFALTVTDDANRSVKQEVSLKVSADPGRALYSEFVDQSKDAADEKTKTATKTLGRQFTFVPGDTGQKVAFTNEGTHGNVSVVSVTVRGPLPATTEKTITVEDAGVQPEGAWRIKKDDGFTSYEDNNENKGASHVTFPVNVEKPGKYEVAFTWRRYRLPEPPKAGAPAPKGRLRGMPTNGAENVLVEVVSRDKDSRLAVPPPPPVPPKGEARFFVDQTLDTIPFADLKTAFQFGPNDGIEIRNDGTRKRVVADAVRLMPAAAKDDGGSDAVLLKSNIAAGRDKWAKYKGGTFRAYNTVGPDIFQDTDPESGDKRMGLGIAYKPVAAKGEGYDPAKFYRVGVVFPGQVENESRVPVVVRAQASSPIVQVVAPYHAAVGAPVKVDASSTFNLQHSKLKFRWEQIGGPRVTLKDPTTPVQAFSAPAMTAQQAAWEGLCRALMAHPDFLFTRPRSLTTATDPKMRRRLQLVKVAQDLVGRAPTAAEVAKVDSGAPLSTLVDAYLKSPEFKEFYFRRVRLYLESHGTPEQDEPARLWSYIALNDRPFKEIMTADYTVGTDWKKQARPPYHGKTGVLTMKGFIEGKPGLPHFNYPAQVCEKFLGYVFEVPDEILQSRDGITAAATTDPNSVCYTCHKVLTPLAYQRTHWDDAGNYRVHDEMGLAIDASDQALVKSYPFKGSGIESFAVQAQNKERFVRTILQTHFVWYFGRELRYEADERGLYKRLWDVTAKNNYALRPLIRAVVLSPEYLSGPAQAPEAKPSRDSRMARLAAFHRKALTPNPSPRFRRGE
jgi:hypothetical protein